MSDSRPLRPVFPAALAVALMFAFGADTVAAETADDRRLRQLAGQAEHPVQVKALLARGADPNVPDRDGRTALHAAASIGAVETMGLLLEAGGKPNLRDKDGNTPLHFASDLSQGRLSPLGSSATIGLLLQAGANADLANDRSRTPLHLLAAGSHGTLGAIPALIRAGAEPNRKDRGGNTPLHAALGPGRGYPVVVRALLAGGADPKIVNERGFSALQMFVALGQDSGDTAAMLIEAGADPDRKWRNGDAPLHTAIRGGGTGKVEVAKALLAGGADPCVRDAKGYTPYQIAAKGGAIHQALDRAGGHDLGCDKKGQEVAGGGTGEARVMQARTRSNVRSGPGTQHGKVGLLETGQKVQVIGEAGDWLRIEMPGGGEAFVYGPLLVEPPAVIVLEPKCGGSQRWQCWKEFANRPGCHFWHRYLFTGAAEDSWSWSGKCDGGTADGEGTLGALHEKTAIRLEARAAISAGHVALKGGFDVKRPSDKGEQEPVRQDTASVTPAPAAEPSITQKAEPTPPARTQDMPDEATRERVADAWKQCLNLRRKLIPVVGVRSLSNDRELREALSRAGDRSLAAIGHQYIGKCLSFYARIREGEHGQRCWELARTVGRKVVIPVRVIWDSERYLNPGSRLNESERRTVREYIRTCVPAYAAALDGKKPVASTSERPRKDTVAAVKPKKAEPAVVIEPKCRTKGGDGYMRNCWFELINKRDCYAWVRNPLGLSNVDMPSHSTARWSGDCVDGLADGQGVLTGRMFSQLDDSRPDADWTVVHEGVMSKGKKQGRWVERRQTRSNLNFHEEGTYIDGQRNGKWISRSRYACFTASFPLKQGESFAGSAKRC